MAKPAVSRPKPFLAVGPAVDRKAVIRLVAGLLVAWPALAVIYLLSAGKGLALTSRWSAALAIWLLCFITVVLHLLVRSQSDAKADDALVDATKKADDQRRVAGNLADISRTTSAAARARRAGLKSLVIGADGRASTSKLQAVMWTYALLLVFFYMLFLNRTLWHGAATPTLPSPSGTFDKFIHSPLQPEYFALLGLPIVAAVTAKAL